MGSVKNFGFNSKLERFLAKELKRSKKQDFKHNATSIFLGRIILAHLESFQQFFFSWPNLLNFFSEDKP